MQSTTKAGLEMAVWFAFAVACCAAEAHPDLNVPCSSCHTNTTGRITVGGNDTTAALSSRLDGGTSDPLKVFTVRPGDTAVLKIDVTNGDARYDPVIYNLDGRGVEKSFSDILSFTPDPTWKGDFSSHTLPYFTFSPVGLVWDAPGRQTSFTYQLAVLPETPNDYYAVSLGASGLASTLARWTQVEEVYVHVVPEPNMLLLLGSGLAAALGWSRRKGR